ncbi:MAG: hypothetical protein WC061_01865 [Melioribacteraceae bacterium]
MNPSQKKILAASLTIILISLTVWVYSGREIFTKNQILVEKKDELFPDMVQKVWVDKFIWGLDLTGAIILTTVVAGIFFYRRLRDKKK